MADEDGFLSRWSRRKVQVRQGVQPAEPPAPAAAPGVPKPPAPVAAAVVPEAAEASPPPAPPPPTLDEVSRLSADAPDFSRFVARDVTPDVRNAALKKLFTDPHFNVMDGLDIYIDDYSRPDPLPASMLRQLAQGRFLGLLGDDDAPPGEAAAAPAHNAPDVTASTADTPNPEPEHAALAPPHEDPDLRLQPHDAAGRPGDPAGIEPQRPDPAA